MNEPALKPAGIILISTFFLLLSYAGYIAYQSIDWTVLERLESQQLVLPTPISSTSATVLSPSPGVTPPAKNLPSQNRPIQN